MKKETDISLESYIPEQDLEGLFPYACLSCIGISEIDLKKANIVSSARIISSEQQNIFYLTNPRTRPGEHKLQTIALFAEMLLLNKIQPQAKMSLRLQVDFMNDVRPIQKEHYHEFQDVPEGSLKVSAACKLFLSQAGVDMSSSSGHEVYSSKDIQELCQRFLQLAPSFKIAKGA